MGDSDSSGSEAPDSPIGRRRLARRRLLAAAPPGSALVEPDGEGCFCAAAVLPAQRGRDTTHALDHRSRPRVVVSFAQPGRAYGDRESARAVHMLGNGVRVVFAPPHGRGAEAWLRGVLEALAATAESGVVVLADCAETAPLRAKLRQAGDRGKVRTLRSVSVVPVP